ncbi:MAG: hypothetical protein IPM26_06880 [Saprospiraceae bacterium]|nr:hypothetical protein [Saprospiraceae bacterium]
MIHLHDMTKIREQAAMHRKSPGEHVWLKLEKRLYENKFDRKVKWYRIALAASVLLLFISIAMIYLNLNQKQHHEGFMSSFAGYKTEELAPDTQETDPLFATDKISELKQAYGKLGLTGKG